MREEKYTKHRRETNSTEEQSGCAEERFSLNLEGCATARLR
jgi:hypothetical protein